ncbi:MAG: AAA family ATPase [Deltaproteobacteria bacterium]|nr:AAA family ATPase [Deltaproteobacteria bacterium]
MLKHLRLRNVGPAPELEMSLAPRLNLVTGDNGLGKTFLLDVAWWALTRTWARYPALPAPPPAEAELSYQYDAKTKAFEHTSRFDRATERWSMKHGRPPNPGLVLYAQVDGGFSVWDPARNYWKDDEPERPASYLFSAAQVWDGNDLCEGLIRDWASWQRENGSTFAQLKAVLRTLSPSLSDALVPGELRKLSLDDPKRYPTLRMPYGEEVAVIHASAGMRRVIALAYLLVWTWQEHVAACQLRGDTPAREIIFLIDEIEAHLHPQWQRRVVPALLEVMSVLTGQHAAAVQLLAATHSPLVLASIEPHFKQDEDRVFLLDIDPATKVVQLHEQPWSMQGDVVNWLVSESFGLHQGRSLEAEQAIEAAEAWMRGERAGLPSQLATQEAIHAELVRVLAEHDPFWPRWVVSSEKAAKGA